MQKWNVPPDRAQKVDEKMGEFVYSSCLLRELWSLKFQKWLFFVISTDASKKSVTIWRNYLRAFERSHLALSENAMDLSDSEPPLASYQLLKIVSLFFCWLSSFLEFIPSISHEWQLQDQLNIPLSERTQRDLSGALKCFAYTVTNVLLPSAKNTKNEAFFDILMTITPGANMITRKMTPFSSTLQALSVGIFYFCI